MVPGPKPAMPSDVIKCTRQVRLSVIFAFVRPQPGCDADTDEAGSKGYLVSSLRSLITKWKVARIKHCVVYRGTVLCKSGTSTMVGFVSTGKEVVVTKSTHQTMANAQRRRQPKFSVPSASLVVDWSVWKDRLKDITDFD